MVTKIARIAVVALTLATGLTLSACTVNTSGVSAFDREQAAEDQVPTAILESSDLVPESTRLLVEIEETPYFAARMADSSNVCLVHVRDEDDWGVACSSGLPLTSTGADGKEILFTAGGRLPDANGWHFVADNVAIRDASSVE
jgi:hypothetical protein